MVGRDFSFLLCKSFPIWKALVFLSSCRMRGYILYGGCFVFSENVVFLLLLYFEGGLLGFHRPCRGLAVLLAQTVRDGLHASWSRGQRSGLAGHPRWVRRRVLPRCRRVLILQSELRWRRLDAVQLPCLLFLVPQYHPLGRERLQSR